MGTRRYRCSALSLVLAAGLVAGCAGGGSIVYQTGYTAGTIIDALFVEPSLVPRVTIEIVEARTSTGIVTLNAKATSYDPPLTFAWEQTSGEVASISNPTNPVTEIVLPAGQAAEFTFQVTVTDASGREASDEIQLNLNLGG
jgi:hypothetical protein